jgi:hypothetical protein
MPRTLVVSTAAIALSTVAATGVMADSAGSLRAGGFHAGGRHAGGFHPGGVHAGGIPARGLAVGHPAGATPRHGFTATPFPAPAMAGHWHGGWARPHYGWHGALAGHRHTLHRQWHPHRYAWGVGSGLNGLYAYRSASPYCDYTSPYYAPHLCQSYSW